jgi:hypothetical protein
MAHAIPAGWLYDWVERSTELSVHDWFKLGPVPPSSDTFMEIDAMEPVFTHLQVVDDFGYLVAVLIEK